MTAVNKIIICITFFHHPRRPNFLRKVVMGYEGIAKETIIYVITNLTNKAKVEALASPLPAGFDLRTIHPRHIGHPYLLTWCHREILTEVAIRDEDCYFLYSEDDLRLTADNVLYWNEHRSMLAEHGLYPSLFRVEHNGSHWVSTDCAQKVTFTAQPILIFDTGECFINLPNPYQGLYLLDPQLIQEMTRSPATSPDFGPWNIREKAAQGLTFVNVPRGFTSRNIAKINPSTLTIDERSWIHHLPNNYALAPNSHFGSVRVDELFEDRDLMLSLFAEPPQSATR